jgi:hypothetical protein
LSQRKQPDRIAVPADFLEIHACVAAAGAANTRRRPLSIT